MHKMRNATMSLKLGTGGHAEVNRVKKSQIPSERLTATVQTKENCVVDCGVLICSWVRVSAKCEHFHLLTKQDVKHIQHMSKVWLPYVPENKAMRIQVRQC